MVEDSRPRDGWGQVRPSLQGTRNSLSWLAKTRGPARLFGYATVALLTVGAGVAGAYAAGGMTADAVSQDQTGQLIPLPRIGMRIAAMQHEAAARAGTASPLDQLLGATVLTSPSPLRIADPAEVAHDIDCLTAAVYYEARGEPREGQAAVAQVVLNRLRDAHFPKTVCGVVYQGLASHECQFTFACNGATAARREPDAWDRAKAVATRALDGYVTPAVGGATHYHVASLGEIWGNQLVRVARIGQHVFYRRHGGAAHIAAAASAPGEPAAAPVELRGALKPVSDPVGAVLTAAPAGKQGAI
jgi:cell wall hydrolase